MTSPTAARSEEERICPPCHAEPGAQLLTSNEERAGCLFARPLGLDGPELAKQMSTLHCWLVGSGAAQA